MLLSNLLFNSTGSELNQIRGYPIYVCERVWQRHSLYNTSSCQLCASPATRGEGTSEEVDTLCCQVGLWEDEGELAESARLISLYTTSPRDLQTCLFGRQSWSWWLHCLTTTYFAWVKEKICVYVHLYAPTPLQIYHSYHMIGNNGNSVRN